MTALRSDHLPAGWELLQPLPLHIGQNQVGQIVVSEEIFDIFGVGATEEDALRDYWLALLAFYEVVADAAAQGKDVMGLLDRLDAYLKRVEDTR